MVCDLYLVTAEGCLQPDRTVETGLGTADSQGANAAPPALWVPPAEGNLKTSGL